MTKEISSYFFSVPISMLVGSWKNVPGQVTATWDAPAEKIQKWFFIIQQNEGKNWSWRTEIEIHPRKRGRRRSYRVAAAIW